MPAAGGGLRTGDAVCLIVPVEVEVGGERPLGSIRHSGQIRPVVEVEAVLVGDAHEGNWRVALPI